MFSKRAIPAALLALSAARLGSCAGSPKPALAPTGFIKFVNLAVNGSAFFLPDERIGVHTGSRESGEEGIWRGYQTGNNRYVFQNVAEEGYIVQGESSDRLLVHSVPAEKATEFAVAPAGEGGWVIKLPNEDKFWEVVSEGGKFGYVSLTSMPSDSQRWSVLMADYTLPATD